MRLIRLILLGILLATPCWADQPVQPEPEKPTQHHPIRTKDIIDEIGRPEPFDFLGRFELDGNWGFNYRLKEFKPSAPGVPATRFEIRGPVLKKKGRGGHRGFTPGINFVIRF